MDTEPPATTTMSKRTSEITSQQENVLPEELLTLLHQSPISIITLAKYVLNGKYTDLLLPSIINISAAIFSSIPPSTTQSQTLALLGRIVPFAEHLLPFTTQYLTHNKTIPTDHEGLLGLLRLLRSYPETLAPLINPQDVIPLLHHRAIKSFLAVLILQITLSGAESWTQSMLTRWVGVDSIPGICEGRDFNLRTDFTKLEKSRADCLRGLLKTSKPSLKVSQPEGVVKLGKVLFFKEGGGHSSASASPSPKTSVSVPAAPQLIPTPTLAKNIDTLSELLKSSHPILLTGPAGSGKTTLIRYAAAKLNKLDKMVTMHLSEQSDAKLLLGLHTTGSSPGELEWKPGVLTTAVEEGRWVCIEDLDRATAEVMGTILPLVERGELQIPGRVGRVAGGGFRLLATVRTGELSGVGHFLGKRHWRIMGVDALPVGELRDVVRGLYPTLGGLGGQVLAMYARLLRVEVKSSTGTVRACNLADLLKLCRRVECLMGMRGEFTTASLDDVFLEGVDCFAASLPDGQAKGKITAVIAEELQIDPRRRDYLLEERNVNYKAGKGEVVIGRYRLMTDRHGFAGKGAPFSINPHTSRTLERVAAAVVNREPMLLVGETGVGKTSAVQYLARLLGKRLVPFNLSQQSEAGDILGGFKPVTARSRMMGLSEEFTVLFDASFSSSKNVEFVERLGRQMNKGNWKGVCKLWRQAVSIVDQQRPRRQAEEAPSKRQKKAIDFSRWDEFSAQIAVMERQLKAGSDGFTFSFVQGNIVKAMRNGDWVLLDEINLASPDTLEAIADLFDPAAPSLLLTEAGNIERIPAHPDFRVFAAMNPATDVGRKELPPGIRSRFTELFVESPDKDIKSLQLIVKSYLPSSPPAIALEVSQLYQRIITLSNESQLVDGAGQKPHFSLRTLTRTLTYARSISTQCPIQRALYEGFQMTFLTLLNLPSTQLIQPLIIQSLLKHPRAELEKPLLQPSPEYIQPFPGSKHYLLRGPLPLSPQEHYILTPFITHNLENLVRAASTRQFPILLQGPTSSGKTSMISYLAARTGHKFIRINNHEHTDLSEYLGTYTSTESGSLQFTEGLLIRALREGYWLVLDELNLASTEILEALNRLLDDNREIMIPETQEVVRPHKNFLLFATQNPAGLYGGRKTLSRAFRNRFVEIHFDEIPQGELVEVLAKRTRLPESWCGRIGGVYSELALRRRESALFERRGFATLRDLFRWAGRKASTVQELGTNGFLLLGERVRSEEERAVVKSVIESVMSRRGAKVEIDVEGVYGFEVPKVKGVVWTTAMRRLFTLVERAVRNNEPVLLVGETGCGKTSVVQVLAEVMGRRLRILNAHQNTETGDLIGSQRPVRERATVEGELRERLSDILEGEVGSTESLLRKYDGVFTPEQREGHTEIKALRTRFKALFEWVDGSLVLALKQGDFFLLDEISLADDSVLERINSVLETDRSITLAEKGSFDATVTAAPGFQFFATMNPGGDYGKRELSPALRNRFTEIWVPALSDLDDILLIVSTKLIEIARPYAKGMIAFAQWFRNEYNTTTTSAISIRDVLSWTSFVNAFSEYLVAAIVHGAAMVYIDTLGASPAGLISFTGRNLDEERKKCLTHLSIVLNIDAAAIYNQEISIQKNGSTLHVGPFTLPCSDIAALAKAFSFDVETTRKNALRVVRAMQVKKPILLEGSPGVGKTALVTALAEATNTPLTRINLSEQTDLIDLFGGDVPAESTAETESSSQVGTFTFRPSPLFLALQNGTWILLDELNLAPQSILEGLNSLLDHRGEVYIPELGKTFTLHPEFRIFAAQNPHHEGGGRKGLPASFVNRFTVVYADAFTPADLTKICRDRFSINPEKPVEFIRRLSSTLNCEVNLRDLVRFCTLSQQGGILRSGSMSDYISVLFALRFRTAAERATVLSLAEEIFGKTKRSDLVTILSPEIMQCGLATLPRDPIYAPPFPARGGGVIPLRALEATMLCIQHSWPVILTGASGAGKTLLVRRLAAMVGAKLTTIEVNKETDANDLIGGFEQLDPGRDRDEEAQKANKQLIHNVKQSLLNGEASLPTLHGNAPPAEKVSTTKGSFQWRDSPLISALQEGNWILIENANLCPSSVLDRLNSLLEPGGNLLVSENANADGSARVITPDRKCRVILTVDPRFGEVSRAMGNRGVQIYITSEEGEGVVESSAMQEGGRVFVEGSRRENGGRELGGLYATALREASLPKGLVGYLPEDPLGNQPLVGQTDELLSSAVELAVRIQISSTAGKVDLASMRGRKGLLKAMRATRLNLPLLERVLHEITSLRVAVELPAIYPPGCVQVMRTIAHFSFLSEASCGASLETSSEPAWLTAWLSSLHTTLPPGLGNTLPGVNVKVIRAMWIALKPPVPRTLEELGERITFEELVRRFDDVALGMGGSLDEVLRLRGLLRDAPAAGKTGELVQGIKNLVPDEKREAVFRMTWDWIWRRLAETDDRDEGCNFLAGREMDITGDGGTAHGGLYRLKDLLPRPFSIKQEWWVDTLIERLRDVHSVPVRDIGRMAEEVALLEKTVARMAGVLCRLDGDLKGWLRRLVEELLADVPEVGQTLGGVVEYLDDSLGAAVNGQDATAAAGNAMQKGKNQRNGTDAGQAWKSLARACLTLYVPSVPYDPALQTIIENRVQQNLCSEAERELQCLIFEENSRTGETDSLRIRFAKEYLSLLQEDSLARGMEGLGMKLEAATEVVRPLVSQTAALHADLQTLLRCVQQDDIKNLLLARERILSYRAYADYVLPVSGFVDAFLIGEMLSRRASLSYNDSAVGKLIPFASATYSSWQSESAFLTAFRSCSSLHYNAILLLLHAFSVRSTIWKIDSLSPEMRTTLSNVFETLYQRWKAHQIKKGKETEKKSALYHYKDEETQPSESLSEEEPDTSNFPLTKLANLHKAIFLQQEESNIIPLLAELAETDEDKSFATVLVALNNLPGRVDDDNYDFYTDANVAQIRLLSPLLGRIYARLEEIHGVFPEHATPLEGMRAVELIREHAHSLPLPRFLPPLERLYATMGQWEDVASKEFSVENLIEEVVGVVVQWRRIELGNWGGVLRREAGRVKEKSAMWWAVAYEVLFAREAQGDGDSYAERLLSTLDDFLHAAPMGEFEGRVEMLKGFIRHLEVGGRDGVLRTALANFVAFYEKYVPIVGEKLNASRTTLEKEVAETQKLASWKERDVRRLKEGMERVHERLLKLVRRWRETLAEPVGSVLEAGLPETKSETKPPIPRLPTPETAQSDEMTTTNAWLTRPPRFINIASTVNLMTSKLPPITLTTTHDIKSFTKTLLSEILTLRTSTSSIKSLTEETKPQIQHLKVQKTRLLAETLRQLREMGFSTNPSQITLKAQATLPAICVNSPLPLPSEAEFHRLLALMPQIRHSARRAHEDVKGRDTSRGLNLLEGVFAVVLAQRHVLSEATAGVERLSVGVYPAEEENEEGECIALATKTAERLLGMQAAFGGEEAPEVTLSGVEALKERNPNFRPVLEGLEAFLLQSEQQNGGQHNGRQHNGHPANAEESTASLLAAADAVLARVQSLPDPIEGKGEGKNWVLTASKNLTQILRALHLARIADHLSSTACGPLRPIFETFLTYATTHLDALQALHHALLSMALVLGREFINLNERGFCSPAPPQEGEANGKVEPGTGLGEGEGEEDISNQIGDEEDLGELAEEKGGEQPQEGGEGEGVDMTFDEMNGTVDEGGEQEGEGDEEEEIGSVDEDEQVDERMWDDGMREEGEEGEEGKVDEGRKEDGRKDEKGQKEDGQDDGGRDAPQEEGEQADEETERVGGEQKEEGFPEEMENLGLPEDLDLDLDLEGKDGEDEISVDEDMEPPGEGLDDDVAEDAPAEGEDATAEEGSPEDDDAQEDSQDEMLQGDDAAEEDDQGMETALPDDANASAQDTLVQGEIGTGADETEDTEMQQTAPAEQQDEDGSAPQEELSGKGTAGQGEDATEPAEEVSEGQRQPYKQLGDALDEWYRQSRQIQAASTGQNQDQDVDMADAAFEHLADDKAEADAQALGAASIEESMNIDKDKGLASNENMDEFVDKTEHPQREPSPIPESEPTQQTDNTTLINSRPPVPSEPNNPTDRDPDGDTDMSPPPSPSLPHSTPNPWTYYLSNTHTHSISLTEQLRLILTPTQSTKLSGSFRTGKRLNLRSILPYIASGFKKDKIWHRRSIPTKRTYKIMLCIDDSLSMSSSAKRGLVYETLALLAQSFAMLEVGDLAVLKFGTDVQILQEFDSVPLVGQRGEEVITALHFDQKQTDVAKLLHTAMELFKGRDASRKLQIILSDGIFSDPGAIAPLVRRAKEEGVLTFVVVLDEGIMQGGEGILELKSVVYDKGEVEVRRYMDGFPFEYYLLVRSVEGFGGVLAHALREWIGGEGE
ncbi:P-loop containing nucleoside triphosphate hydrolase protein [Piedraia hortae CBS 480.64]|uniref:Midasin n=1 Tax=Piedraia hortae CBS 480.64 TaxID=1314780 RepID=A0A6A7C481_9PEZI|nr:P-loop containing nucleoside triphosphate hydrolase protein [Piedraia hortae CBS 480.64]